MVAGAGNTVNLIVAVLAGLVLRMTPWERSTTRLALTLVLGVNLFTWAGYFLFSGATGIGDWGDGKEQMLWLIPNAGLWRGGEFALGAAAYVMSMRLTGRVLGTIFGGGAGLAQGGEADGVDGLLHRQRALSSDRPSEPGGDFHHPGVGGGLLLRRHGGLLERTWLRTAGRGRPRPADPAQLAVDRRGRRGGDRLCRRPGPLDQAGLTLVGMAAVAQNHFFHLNHSSGSAVVSTIRPRA